MHLSKLLIGCSGYYYPGWKGKFYPKELKPKEWLGYYSSVFNTVELNGTFYRLPKLADLKKYYTLTGEKFRFSVKMNRYITHISKLKDCKEQIAEFHTLVQDGLQDKLCCILYQMPPSFTYTAQHLDTLIESVPAGKYHVVELRHQSWWNDEVYKAFRQAGITFCNIDFPGLETPLVATIDFFYLRLHGNPDLFKSSYSPQALKKFRQQIPAAAKQVNIYFNNTYYEAGYTNALQMMGLF
jgi:uncharacterized protein YecE (DUF72 family)